MCQVAAYKRSKTIENYKAVTSKSGRRRSLTRGSNYRALAGKNLLFWIGGRLREVLAHGGSIV